MLEYRDSLGRMLSLKGTPQRIVSLVPSVTEVIFALGAGDQVVGVTSYCTQPGEALQKIKAVGGTKNPDIGAILELNPDLVIFNDEENRHEDFRALHDKDCPIYVTAPRTVESGIRMVKELGDVVGRSTEAESMVHSLLLKYRASKTESSDRLTLRVFCPIWRKPWMSFNWDTYSNDMLRCCGGENIFAGAAERYFSLALDEVVARNPHVVILPSEPYPFSEKHLVDFRPLEGTYAGKGGHFYPIDGMGLCWYGPRSAGGLKEIGELFSFVRDSLES